MAHYFSYLPTTNYKIDGLSSSKTDRVVDITRRFKIIQLLNSREAVYYSYQIQEGDRPDIVAEKFYGDSRLDWLVLLPNEIHDRYYDWPMSQNEFVDYIRSQYGSVSSAQGTVHHYEQILSAKQVLTDGTIIPERTVRVDETTYNSLSSLSRRSVSVFDHEETINESRREIKLIDPTYATEIVRTARRAYR